MSSVQMYGVILNAGKGSRIQTNANNVILQKVVQNVNGGKISHLGSEKLVEQENCITVNNQGTFLNQGKDITITDSEVDVDNDSNFYNLSETDADQIEQQ